MMKTRRFGLIGHPIAHSLSPYLFKAGYAGKYPYDLIETPDFEDAFEEFVRNYDGINVTAPFKELAIAKADILSEECQLIRATNLIVKTPEGIKAHNSDYMGVRMWLEEVVPPSSDPSGMNVLVAGMGGAGKAAAAAAASLGMGMVLMNRDMSKAEAAADRIASMKDAPRVQVRPLEDFKDCFLSCDIIIYSIPAAIPQLADIVEEDMKGTDGKHLKHILEANYKDPSFTPDMLGTMMSANPGIRYTQGKTWLLYQALTGYEIFTGQKPDLVSMHGVL